MAVAPRRRAVLDVVILVGVVDDIVAYERVPAAYAVNGRAVVHQVVLLGCELA